MRNRTLCDVPQRQAAAHFTCARLALHCYPCLHSTYLYRTSHDSNLDVGFALAAMALSQVLAAPAAGGAADRYSRDFVLRAAGVMGIVASAASFVAFLITSFQLLVGALACWGLFTGTSSGVCVSTCGLAALRGAGTGPLIHTPSTHVLCECAPAPQVCRARRSMYAPSPVLRTHAPA